MFDIILWSLLSFFSAFGILEFIRFIYSDWHCDYDSYHITVSTKNLGKNIESVLRNIILKTNSPIIVIDDNSDQDIEFILKKLQNKYECIRIMSFNDYINFIQSKEC